jgi:hypothetical protein
LSNFFSLQCSSMLHLFCHTSRWRESSERCACKGSGDKQQPARDSKKRKLDKPNQLSQARAVLLSSHTGDKIHSKADLREAFLTPSQAPRLESNRPSRPQANVASYTKAPCKTSATALTFKRNDRSAKSVARNTCHSKGVPKYQVQQHKAARRGHSKTNMSSSITQAATHKSAHNPLGCHIRQCARCTFALHHRSWSGGVASHSLGGPTVAAASPSRLSWLGERPNHFGGEWGIGCSVCAHFLGRVVSGDLKHSAAQNKRRSYSTKWSRYEVRGYSSMQACSLRQHSLSTLHQLALKCFFCPASVLIPASQTSCS